MGARIPPRMQGDVGELSAIGWLFDQGADVYLPLGHSPEVDLVADWGDRLVRIQVKTSTVARNDRFEVTLATRGGNRSWNGVSKLFRHERCDYLFVHVGDGRRWFIPSSAVAGGSGILLGGPKYEAYEVASDRPLTVLAEGRIARLADPPAGFRSGQTGAAVNRVALPSQVRILPPP